MRGSDATDAQRAGLVPAAVDRRTAAPLKGIALMLLAGLFYTLNNAAMKLVLEDIPLGQAILIRGLVVCAPLLLLTRRRGGQPFRRSRLGAQSVCAILSATVGTPRILVPPPCGFGISTARTGGGK